ncbi:MAG: S41 family peptidase [Planctomycetota bacterium]
MQRPLRHPLLVTVHVAGSVLLAFAFAHAGGASENRPLLRFPHVHGDKVVFTHAEDIWKAPVQGGVAQRLTVHEGEERFPRFSPDGSLIAFTGDYDGNTDVYVMDSDGGHITRATFHPSPDEVIGWHPLQRKILFRSSRVATGRVSRLYLVNPDGTGLQELILHEAANGTFSPDGKKIAYNRVAREHRTWKRYAGGLAQDLWLFDFTTNEARRVTDFPGTDRTPMWYRDKIYFVSDRDRVLNVYAYDTRTGKIDPITHHTDYDVIRASLGDGQIAYELGGEIWRLDLQTHQTARIPIDVRADNPDTRPYMKDVSGDVTHIACSPSGNRALIVARGEVFTVPKEHGPTRNLTESCGARDKEAAWSPDGKHIATISDQSGEYAIHLLDPLGNDKAIQLTRHADGYRHTLRWSPDSKKIAFADQTLRFYYVDVETGVITEVDRSPAEPVDVAISLKPIHDFAWSPDSRYIAYSRIDTDLVSRVYIYSLEERISHCTSGDLLNDFGPVFSRDGKHLFFISNRRFDPTFCDFEWEMVYKKVAGIYALTLARDGERLFPLESDEEKVAEQKTEPAPSGTAPPGGETKPAAAESTKSERVRINFEGLAGRIEALPLPRSNYRQLSVNEDSLFYLDADEGDFNRFDYRPVGPRNLHAFSFKERKAHTVIEGITRYALAAGGTTIAYQKGNEVGLIAASSRDSKGERVDLSGLKVWFDPRAEWQQIYNEAWRLERDFYYEPNMHGVDWPAIKVKYARLVAAASCRQDIHYLIGEMIGELNTSHTYVSGGDVKRRAQRVNVGMLGADWTLDAPSGRYRIAKIYGDPDWTDEVYPPLAGPGIDVREGDFLLEVNGDQVTGARDIHSYFQGLAGKQIALLVNDKPSPDEARRVTVVPLASEFPLRYRAWVEHNRKVVEKESGGLIGYMHLPDTFTGSCREFPEYFYGQTQKKALLIDGRFNGGGLDPDIFLQRLDKPLLAYWTRRYSQHQTTPAVVTRAHLALLTNRQAGSGGDMLPMEFQQRHMGPVIGTRTWGGLVGVSMFIDLIDGGLLTAPDYRIYNPEGKWVVENTGVTPDIEVELSPAEMARGYDAQLMRGIEYLMQKIKEEPRERPQHEPFPVDKG